MPGPPRDSATLSVAVAVMVRQGGQEVPERMGAAHSLKCHSATEGLAFPEEPSQGWQSTLFLMARNRSRTELPWYLRNFLRSGRGVRGAKRVSKAPEVLSLSRATQWVRRGQAPTCL